MTELFEKGDAAKLPQNRTLWAAYNSVTRYEDYREAREDGADRRLDRVWFGPGADLKLHALHQAEVLAAQWGS